VLPQTWATNSVAINFVRTDDRPAAGTDADVSMAIGRMIHYATHASR
jgi:hypothetical protein